MDNININLTKECLYCKQSFNLTVSNKKYCNSKCKQLRYYIKYKERNLSYYHLHIKDNEFKLKKRKEYILQWRKDNPNRIRLTKRIYYNNRLRNDIGFKLIHNLNTRIRKFIKSKNFNPKRNTTVEIIGCTPKELKHYIENKFTRDMNWNNFNKIHLDHIIPLASAKTNKELISLCHYTNLQPLWVIDNLKKGSKV